MGSTNQVDAVIVAGVGTVTQAKLRRQVEECVRRADDGQQSTKNDTIRYGRRIRRLVRTRQQTGGVNTDLVDDGEKFMSVDERRAVGDWLSEVLWAKAYSVMTGVAGEGQVKLNIDRNQRLKR